VQANVTVLYLANGFSPSAVRIGIGQTVVFKNTLNQDLRVSSNPHPTHTDYQGFDSGRILLRDEEYAFTFTKKGTFGYHNHIIPNHGGAVIVE
jgi:plastocyanin